MSRSVQYLGDCSKSNSRERTADGVFPGAVAVTGAGEQSVVRAGPASARRPNWGNAASVARWAWAALSLDLRPRSPRLGVFSVGSRRPARFSLVDRRPSARPLGGEAVKLGEVLRRCVLESGGRRARGGGEDRRFPLLFGARVRYHVTVRIAIRIGLTSIYL